MTPYPVDVVPLGLRHRNINARVNAILQKNIPIDKICEMPEFANSDVDKLVKIDVIANSSKNLPLIEKVLCCDDMLLVSRAINKSRWLANDPRITPDYLDTNLFPHMSSKAISKLLLSIRKNITDERKSEQFYLYFMSRNEKDKALPWLPMCSAQVIKKRMADLIRRSTSLTREIFKRIVRKMPVLLEDLAIKDVNILKSYLEEALFLLRTNTNEYLNFVEKKCMLKFNPKATRFLLNNHSERVMNNRHIYVRIVHLPTLAKYIDKENILEFLVDLTRNEKILDWFNSPNLKPFIIEMPQDIKVLFFHMLFSHDTNASYLKSLLGENFHDFGKLTECSTVKDLGKVVELCRANKSWSDQSISQPGYDWYFLAPFPIALEDGFKRSELHPKERLLILSYLIMCCKNDLKNLCVVLDHFTQSHIHEDYRLRFVETVISDTNTHNYDDVTWAKLDLIFHKLGVYADDRSEGSNSKVIAKAIVVYNVLHRKTIPEVFLKKYDLRLDYQLHAWTKNFDEDQKQQIFIHIYDSICNKGKNISEDERFIQTVQLLHKWDKDLTDFPQIITEIRRRINCNDESIDTIRYIYKKNKGWRRILFPESFLIEVKENVCLNILKHDPNLILNNERLQYMSRKDHLVIDRFLKKVRVYFDDLTDIFLTVYKNSIAICSKEHSGYQAMTRGLCILLERDQFCRFLETYIPTNNQINWKQADMSLNSIQKYLAGQMYLVRPTIDVANIMKFTKGDFLHYAVPTLLCIAYDMPKNKIKEFVMKCLQGKISIKKLGVRVATAKLNIDQFCQVLAKVWESNRNYSLRAALFKILFDLLKSENETKPQNDDRINILWETMKKYMKSLTSDEDKNIYDSLAAVNSMPEKIRPEFCKISYEFLERLPKKLNCEVLYLRMLERDMENIDHEWLEAVLLSYMKDVTSKTCDCHKIRVFEDLSVSYILCSQTEEIQIVKYNKFLKPHLDNLLDTLKEETGSNEYRYDLLLGYIVRKTKNMIMRKNYAIPLKLLESLKTGIEEKYPLYETYAYVCYLKLAIAYFGSWQFALGDLTDETSMLTRLTQQPKLIEEFIRRVLEIFRHDTSVYFPSLYEDFAQVLKRLGRNVYFDTSCIVQVLIKDKQNRLDNLAAIKVQELYKIREAGEDQYANHEFLEIKLNYFTKIGYGNFFSVFWKTEDCDKNGLERDECRFRLQRSDEGRLLYSASHRRKRRRRDS